MENIGGTKLCGKYASTSLSSSPLAFVISCSNNGNGNLWWVWLPCESHQPLSNQSLYAPWTKDKKEGGAHDENKVNLHDKSFEWVFLMLQVTGNWQGGILMRRKSTCHVCGLKWINILFPSIVLLPLCHTSLGLIPFSRPTRQDFRPRRSNSSTITWTHWVLVKYFLSYFLP